MELSSNGFSIAAFPKKNIINWLCLLVFPLLISLSVENLFSSTNAIIH